ncbi:hypothetical protein [Limnohabitans sp.]|jgi:hypothetical protein|uniref:hypothetical protein n=1 Tax=Limnohabitans sp. TaxID=1907725 RepID=UPI0037C150D0
MNTHLWFSILDLGGLLLTSRAMAVRFIKQGALAVGLLISVQSAWAVCEAELEAAISASDADGDKYLGGRMRREHAERHKNPSGSTTADVFIRAIKHNEVGISRGQVVSNTFGQ